jgi:hypothetical protein
MGIRENWVIALRSDFSRWEGLRGTMPPEIIRDAVCVLVDSSSYEGFKERYGYGEIR